jgi:hypothetical protein
MTASNKATSAQTERARNTSIHAVGPERRAKRQALRARNLQQAQEHQRAYSDFLAARAKAAPPGLDQKESTFARGRRLAKAYAAFMRTRITAAPVTTIPTPPLNAAKSEVQASTPSPAAPAVAVQSTAERAPEHVGVEDVQAAVTRIRQNAGLLPTPLSPNVRTILRNAGKLRQTARERFDALPEGSRRILQSAQYAGMGNFGAPPIPRDPTVLRMLAAYRPSQLTVRERWNLQLEGVKRMLTAYQHASGIRFVPRDDE